MVPTGSVWAIGCAHEKLDAQSGRRQTAVSVGGLVRSYGSSSYRAGANEVCIDLGISSISIDVGSYEGGWQLAAGKLKGGQIVIADRAMGL